jgi:hypothetical protein
LEKVSTEEGMGLASDLQLNFMEVSAKNNFHIDDLFINAAHHAINR